VPSPVVLPKVEVRTVEMTTVDRRITATGVLAAASQVQLAFDAAGRVRDVRVDVGDEVEAGQILAALDAEEYRHSLEAAEAHLEEVEAQHGRVLRLFDKGSVTITDRDRAEAALKEARAAAQILRRKVEDTVLRSPLRGRVARRSTDPGSVVGPGIPVFTVIGGQGIRAAVAVPETDVQWIQTGQPAEIEVPALDGRAYAGTVVRINPTADPLTRTYRIRIDISQPGPELRPGTAVVAAISIAESREVVTLPGSSVLEAPDGGRFVYLLSEDGARVNKRRVFVDGVSGSEVVILEGLAVGDRVVVAGQHRLSESAAVEVVEGPA